MKKLSSLAALIAGLLVSHAAVHAESEFAAYGGIQEAPHSDAKVSGGVTDTLRIKWEGRSFDSPQYYGFRYTNWMDARWGWSVNFTHAKIYSSDASRAREGYTTLEMTDGLNPLTVNAMVRGEKIWGMEPYAGVGLGVSLPHVEIQKGPTDAKTFEYQYGGPVLGLIGGVKYSINDQWFVMAEYHFHKYWLNVKMNPDSRFKSDVMTNAVNLGIGYRW